jgi:tRNA U34 5-carboxymethylaminomethyl modifying enzyme MnmG/GidA
MAKYVGYINKQIEDAQNFQKMEELQIPKDIAYQHMDGLALEAQPETG